MNEMKFIKKLVVLVLVGLLFVAYGKWLEHKIITSAELVEVSETGYIINFDGNEHEYYFN